MEREMNKNTTDSDSGIFSLRFFLQFFLHFVVLFFAQFKVHICVSDHHVIQSLDRTSGGNFIVRCIEL